MSRKQPLMFQIAKKGQISRLKGTDICFRHGCLPFLHVLFFFGFVFSIELELSPQADLTPCLSSSNTSTDKYCQPQTHRASLARSHKQTHTGLRGLINKPPTALFQSLERHIVGLAVCVRVFCYCSAKQTSRIDKIISDIALLSLECIALYVPARVIHLNKGIHS